jgi:hypothetical protein
MFSTPTVPIVHLSGDLLLYWRRVLKGALDRGVRIAALPRAVFLNPVRLILVGEELQSGGIATGINE